MPKNNENTEKKEKTENKEVKKYDPNNSSKLLEEHKREENKEDDPDTVLQKALKNMDNPEKNEKGKEQLDYIKGKLLSEDLRSYFKENEVVMDQEQLKELNKYMFLNIPSSDNIKYFYNWTYILDSNKDAFNLIADDIYKWAKGETNLSIFNSKEIGDFNKYMKTNNISLPDLIGNRSLFFVRLITNIEDNLIKNKK